MGGLLEEWKDRKTNAADEAGKSGPIADIHQALSIRQAVCEAHYVRHLV